MSVYCLYLRPEQTWSSFPNILSSCSVVCFFFFFSLSNVPPSTSAYVISGAVCWIRLLALSCSNYPCLYLCFVSRVFMTNTPRLSRTPFSELVISSKRFSQWRWGWDSHLIIVWWNHMHTVNTMVHDHSERNKSVHKLHETEERERSLTLILTKRSTDSLPSLQHGWWAWWHCCEWQRHQAEMINRSIF